jgi:hypothetical protein
MDKISVEISNIIKLLSNIIKLPFVREILIASYDNFMGIESVGKLIKDIIGNN